MAEKRSTGPNARPRDETIAQSGEGLPDDTGRVPQVAKETDEAAARRSLEALGQSTEERLAQAEQESKSDMKRNDKPADGEHTRASGEPVKKSK